MDLEEKNEKHIQIALHLIKAFQELTKAVEIKTKNEDFLGDRLRNIKEINYRKNARIFLDKIWPKIEEACIFAANAGKKEAFYHFSTKEEGLFVSNYFGYIQEELEKIVLEKRLLSAYLSFSTITIRWVH